MKTSLKYREVIKDARRVIVKIGTRVLVQSTGRPDMRRMKVLVEGLHGIHKQGNELLVVSSGAVGAGMEALGMKTRPTLLPEQQMAAAVGQSRLMSYYDRLFSAKGCIVGQVLLTHFDFQHKLRQTNAQRTLSHLLRRRVIPIVNENDVVADEEIKAVMALGDNDLLAALLATLVHADLLVLLSTTDGVRETLSNGHSRRVRYIESITRKTLALVNAERNDLSKGGMRSKLLAAQRAARAGCTVVIADGRRAGVLDRIMAGDDVGTLIVAGGL